MEARSTPIRSAPVITGDATGEIIPYKNPPTLIAFDMFSLVPLPGLPLGIAGVILGIFGLRLRRTYGGQGGRSTPGSRSCWEV